MTRKSQVSPSGSALVRALEDAYHAVAVKHGLPDVIFVTGAGLEGRSPRWGHFDPERWKAGDDVILSEIFIAGEQIANGAEATFKTLLHEAAHALARARGVKDTSRGGRYHNRTFIKVAGELGLIWPEGTPPSPSLGFSAVVLSDETRDRWAKVIAELGEALDASRPGRLAVAKAASSGRNGLKLVCGCSRILRASTSTTEEGPIICGLCREPFEEQS
jgi:hypothetical protein